MFENLKKNYVKVHILRFKSLNQKVIKLKVNQLFAPIIFQIVNKNLRDFSFCIEELV